MLVSVVPLVGFDCNTTIEARVSKYPAQTYSVEYLDFSESEMKDYCHWHWVVDVNRLPSLRTLENLILTCKRSPL